MALKSGLFDPRMFEMQDKALNPTPAPAPAAQPWTLEGDPLYQSALQQGQAQFNTSKMNAIADIQDQATANAAQRTEIDQSAATARKRLAGNFAARGMAGGAQGALTAAESELNARQLAARTSLSDQIASLNRSFLRNYGAIGTDWRGTNVGQEYVTSAQQQALAAQLARMGVNQ